MATRAKSGNCGEGDAAAAEDERQQRQKTRPPRTISETNLIDQVTITLPRGLSLAHLGVDRWMDGWLVCLFVG